MASIYRAIDMRDGRQVAIKIPHMALEQDPVRADRFRREEEIGTTLNHPNVMKIYADDHRSGIY
ncbi:MAG TPA: hypothetical protein VND66_08525, partial [Acidobacteriaceae bacterium]|nr:hypothetical protein [Acidobacteriaceae bacterium]